MGIIPLALISAGIFRLFRRFREEEVGYIDLTNTNPFEGILVDFIVIGVGVVVLVLLIAAVA